MKHTCSECEKDCTNEWLYLHSKCHPDYPTWTRVRDDVLEVICVECHKLIFRCRIVMKNESEKTIH